MSRAYRIRASETLKRVIRAEDHVSTQLELLEILPTDQMADLLGQELERRGFAREGNIASRQVGEVVVHVELDTGVVTVKAETSESIELKGEKTGVIYEESRRSRAEVEAELRDQVARDLEQGAECKRASLQEKITDKLEAQLGDLRAELDQAVNRATAEALKQKAAQIGQIKQITDDAEGGSLTIVVEV